MSGVIHWSHNEGYTLCVCVCVCKKLGYILYWNISPLVHSNFIFIYFISKKWHSAWICRSYLMPKVAAISWYWCFNRSLFLCCFCAYKRREVEVMLLEWKMFWWYPFHLSRYVAGGFLFPFCYWKHRPSQQVSSFTSSFLLNWDYQSSMLW